MIAEQVAANAFLRFPCLVVLMIASAYLAYFIIRRRWTATIAPGIFIIMTAILLVPGLSYQVTVDKLQRTVSWQGVRSGQVVDAGSAHLNDLSATGLQSGKSGSRVVLVHKDGSEQFPLGTSYLMNEPVQLLLTQELDQLIHHPEVH